jgi:hypothetical protein
MAQWKISSRQAACSICSHEFADGERHHSMVSFTEELVQRGDYCQSCWEKGGTELQQAPLTQPPAGESRAEPLAEGRVDAEAETGIEAEADGEGETAGETAGETTGDATGAATGAAATSDESPDGAISKAEPHRFWWSTHHQAKAPKTLQMDMDALQRLFLELSDREETQLRELRYVLCLLLMRKKRVKLERILRDESGESFIVRRPKLDDRYTVEVFDFTPERMAEVRAHLQAIFDGESGDDSLAQAARGEEPDESTEELAEPIAE